MDTTFQYKSSPARIHVGEGALTRLTKVVDRVGAERAFVVCGQTVAHSTDLLNRIQTELGDRYAGVFDGVQSESPLPSVRTGVQAARDADADLLMAVGGGSAVVTTRAITILLAEEDSPPGTLHPVSTRRQTYQSAPRGAKVAEYRRPDHANDSGKPGRSGHFG